MTEPEAPLGRWGMIRLIARREIVTRVRERSFAVSTLITVLIVVAVVLIPALLNRGGDKVKVGLVGSPAGVSQALEQSAAQQGARLTTRQYDSEGAAEQAVRNGDIDAAFLGPERVLVNDDLDGTVGVVVQAAYREVASSARLAAAGLDPARVAEALSVPPLAVVSLAGRGSDQAARRGAATFGIVLLYGQLIGYSLWVALGVVEEKSSRVVELLLATLRPWQLLTGKIIGIGLLGLAQFILVGAVGVVTAIASQAVSVPAGVLAVVGQVLVWFVLGFAFYACAYAAAAALVSRQEELQNITGPLTILLVGSFFLAIFTQGSPNSTFSQVISLIPPVSVLTMPPRWAGGDASTWQILLSIVLMLLAVLGLIRVAARVYAGAVLRTGPKVKVREALRAGKAPVGRG
jgi:ABC-2 type transport system permease protein